jgi:hypothetical protein
MTDTDLADRVAELEDRAQRIIPAREGADGWVNFIESRVAEEREYFHAVLSELIAHLQRDFLTEAKAMLDQALATRVRGTYQSGASYTRGDIVALDGGSFLARKDNPGK